MTDARAEIAGARPRRDALGLACHAVHLAAMAYIVLGWLVPAPALLGFYLVFLPAVIVQWRFNRNSCVLNNLESLLRTGSWRDPTNREEGAWLLSLAEDALGLHPTPTQLDVFVHLGVAALWGLGLAHLLRA